MQNFHCSLYSHKVILSKNVHWRWSVTVVFHSDQAFPLFSRSHAIICFVNPTLRTDCNLFHCVSCVTFQTQVLTLLQAAAVLYWPASQYLCTLPSNTDVLTSAQVHSVPGKIRMNERKAGPLPPIIWNIIKVFFFLWSHTLAWYTWYLLAPTGALCKKKLFTHVRAHYPHDHVPRRPCDACCNSIICQICRRPTFINSITLCWSITG